MIKTLFSHQPSPLALCGNPYSLYCVANSPSEKDLQRISRLVEGGVSCVQYREYSRTTTEAIHFAKKLQDLLKQTNTPLFLNTSHLLYVASKVHADGVYLEEPIPVDLVRKTLGPLALVGVPVKTLRDVEEWNKSSEINYLSVKVFSSKQTCPKNNPHELWGVEGLKAVCAIAGHPVVAIGGITEDDAEDVYRILRKGDGIAMAGGLMRQEEPFEIARRIQEIREKVQKS